MFLSFASSVALFLLYRANVAAKPYDASTPFLSTTLLCDIIARMKLETAK